MGVRFIDPVMLILFALLPSALFFSPLIGLCACKGSSNWALPSAARSLLEEGTAGLSQSPELGIWIIKVNSMGWSRSPGALLGSVGPLASCLSDCPGLLTAKSVLTRKGLLMEAGLGSEGRRGGGGSTSLIVRDSYCHRVF